MDTEDYEYEQKREQALIEAEEKARMEAEWQELEYDNQLPAKIEILIKTNKETKINNQN